MLTRTGTAKHGRVLLASIVMTVLTSTAAQGAVIVVVNNGLAPPNPDNVYTNAPTPSAFDIFTVRNVGCPPGWPGSGPGSHADPCPSPGASTQAEIPAGANLGFPNVLDSSSLLISGGFVQGLATAFGDSTLTVTGSSGYFAGFAGAGQGAITARDNSNVVVEGGDISFGGVQTLDSASAVINGGSIGKIDASGSSTVTVSGGSISQFFASAQITVVGTSFQVDAVSVPFGDLSASSGTLTGTLDNGDPLDAPFTITGGTITLVGVPSGVPALSRRSLALLGIGFSIAGLWIFRNGEKSRPPSQFD